MEKYRRLFLKGIFTTLLFFSAFYFSPVSAQTDFSNNDISIETIPEIPGPYEDVQVKLISYSYNLDQLNITWLEDGKVGLTGTGEKNFSFISPGLGQTRTVEVRITLPDGELFSRKIITKPSNVDLLWQGVDAYTPPFYRGKALPTSEGVLRVVAMTSFPNNKSVYSWRRNYNAVQDASGYGKNSFTFKNSYLNKIENISVTSNNTEDGSVAQKNIALSLFTPKIIFYEKDPLLGILYNKGITDSVSVGKSDKTLVAEPYFVSPRDPLATDLLYTWKINTKEIDNPDQPNTIVIRSGNESGTAKIDLSIESISKLFLNVKKSLSVNLE